MKTTAFLAVSVVFILAMYQYRDRIKMMLDNSFGRITELSESEMKEVNGGFVMILIAAFAAGVAIYAATHDNSTACPAI